ncbi:MAG TPA: LysM peptidoglycan-binding domain-containing protein [Flavobacterium sp.]
MRLHKHILALILCLLLSLSAIAQPGTKTHTVSQGETVTKISQMYKITPHEIYRLNPNAQQGIKIGDVLKISGEPSTASSSSSETHTVKQKETLYGIAKSHNLSVEELRELNPSVGEGLKTGQVLIVRKRAGTTSAATHSTKTVKNSNSISHKVEARETKFGIAKQYGISVEELERQNPAIRQSLPVGYELTIAGAKDTNEVIADKYEVTTTTIKQGFANYEVKPKETIYSLTQTLGISEDELIRLNPSLKEGLKEGMILKVPGKGSILVATSGKGFKDLSKSLSFDKRRKLAMLLPFNVSKIEGDSAKSVAERLKSDAFLNMTLDFYSGALMAIDSAKTLGLKVDVHIYDSGESRASSNVAEVIRNNNINTFDAVIGPFYQEHAERAAQLLARDSVAVISPLSKDKGESISNLYQAMPPGDYSKTAIFEYMLSKGGNIVVVSAAKRESNREFIKTNFKEAVFSPLDANGNLIPDKLKALLVKDKINYVVLDSEKTGMILSTTNVLLNELANYKIQLVIMEQNETLDFEEISMKRLTILKMLYPSLIRENTSHEALQFDNAYKRENKIFPSQYAIRGFDVTFDTLLRLSQEKSFEATANEDQTEQIESKFNYSKNGTDGYINKGVYILQFEEDLSVTEAK